MTTPAVDVALHLRLQDQATPGLDRAEQQTRAREQRQRQENERTRQQSERNDARVRTSHERTSLARERLGVRSEQRIQREIAATEAAYQRLMRSGVLSATEQARALEATRTKVTALTNEMGKLTAAQERAAKAGKLLQYGKAAVQYGGAAVAAGTAGAAVLAPQLGHAMAVDERLAHLANTAYRERDVRGKRVGMDEMRNAVDSAVNRYGGTRAGATGVLEEMISSGAVSVPDALKMLPSIVKAGTAANADPTQLAGIGIRAMQTFKIRAEDMPNVLNMALAAGQAGGFELKDMARWLPQQMAAATMSGLRGKEGFAKLAALNQAAAITAGSKDEAGNNVVNLLAKINSADTATDAKKLGINLPKYLQDARAKGMDSVDAFGALVTQMVQGRDDYKALQRQLASAKTDGDKRAALESMATIAEGAGIGRLVQDRQALMALLGMLNNQEYMGKVLAEVRANDRASGGAVDANFELISGTGAFRNRRRQENTQAATDRALGDGGSVLGRINDFVGDVAAKFPVLAGSSVVAASGITAMAGAAGLATIALGRLGAQGGLGGFAGAAGRAAPYAMRAGRLLKTGGLLGAGALAGGAALDAVAGPESAVARYGGSMLSGAAMGATVGSVVPVVGTAIGGAIGAGLGGLYELLKGDKPKMQADVRVSVSDDRVRVEQNLRAQGMDAQLQSDALGNVFAGAP